MKQYDVLVNGKPVLTVSANSEMDAINQAETNEHFASVVVKTLETGQLVWTKVVAKR